MTDMSAAGAVHGVLDLVAFYDPQFRSDDAGTTTASDKWMKVRKGRQSFVGHAQPNEPAELGYYDLRDPLTLRLQVALAQEYGIRGFCWPVYRSAGRQILSDALHAMVLDREVDMTFCVCWANGLEYDLLVADRGEDDDRAFIHDIVKYIRDPRYLRIGQRPVFLVRDPNRLRNSLEVTRYWRSVIQEAGCGDLHLCAVESSRLVDPASLGFDALVEMPPMKPLPPRCVPSPGLKYFNKKFRGRVFEYRALRDLHLAQPFWRTCPYYRTVAPRWDTTALNQDEAEIAWGSTPPEYEEWLYWAGMQTLLTHPPGQRLLFINSWNDWSNGNTLEPDRHFQRGYLEATRSALRTLNERAPAFEQYWPIFEAMAEHDNNVADGLRSIIVNYERSVAALRQLGPRMLETNVDDMIDTLPLARLTQIYQRRVHVALERPQIDVTETLRGVPFGALTKAYFGRLALAVSRRVGGMRRR